ncbi:hypothetical protein [Liquorilactobacillus uvarum]|nr:hypothetical protein [Liquorilactobacillus uvarum]
MSKGGIEITVSILEKEMGLEIKGRDEQGKSLVNLCECKKFWN